jgi:hypothetical protein
MAGTTPLEQTSFDLPDGTLVVPMICHEWRMLRYAKESGLMQNLDLLVGRSSLDAKTSLRPDQEAQRVGRHERAAATAEYWNAQYAGLGPDYQNFWSRHYELVSAMARRNYAFTRAGGKIFGGRKKVLVLLLNNYENFDPQQGWMNDTLAIQQALDPDQELFVMMCNHPTSKVTHQSGGYGLALDRLQLVRKPTEASPTLVHLQAGYRHDVVGADRAA